jgi:hypothetical protein
MKIPKEYSLLFIIGLFILAYVLDLIVEPLSLALASPYAYFKPQMMSSFPFSTTSIFIKATAVFLMSLWIISFFNDKSFVRPVVLLVWAGLIQLYAIQDIVTRAELIPIEWSLSLAVAGLALLIPTIMLFIKASIVMVHSNLTNVRMQEAIKKAQQEAEQEKNNS